uniref:Putative secreted protein 94 n=1 Tax=Amblyomma parvum TaxID=251391 RepID=A0A023G1F8_AMBPA
MLFVAAFIAGFGLCAAASINAKSVRNKSDKIYNNTLKAVQNNGTLRLLWYSHELENNLATCLISRFLQDEENGARRTLETNEKTPDQNTKSNITISLKRGPLYPTLKIEAKEGELSAHWSDEHSLEFATGNCFLLDALITSKKKPYCAVWGVNKSNSSCIRQAEHVCEPGRKVDLTQCAPVEKRKNSPTLLDIYTCEIVFL